MLGYVRHNNFVASKKLMGIDGKPLSVGGRVRVSIYAISSEARRMRAQRKASEQTNWTRGLFTGAQVNPPGSTHFSPKRGSRPSHFESS